MNDFQQLGTIELEPHQHELLEKFAETFLNGSYDQAVMAFEVVFEREPDNELDMQIFKALCEQKIKERFGDFGIKGVIKGGKHD